MIVLHAKEVKADFAWATVTNAGLEIDHPALHAFALSRKNPPAIVPELINCQLRNFQVTKWLGHCVFLWTLCDWKDLPVKFLNRTALFMGRAGYTNIFYGPLVVSVVKQDMVLQNKRTLDHVQMRTLRQVADYIQMVDDNPCIINPSRFVSVPERYNPEPGLVPVPAVKINDEAELDIMGLFGMKARKQEVHISISTRAQRQSPAAVPWMLGLKYYTRTARLDMIVETEVFAKVEPEFIWAQWALEILPADPSNPGRRVADVTYAHHHRSMVLVQAGGAPLRTEHIEALTAYLHMNQDTAKDRARISKEGFMAYWEDNYGAGDVPSPYDLEASHPTNLFDHDADDLLAFETVAGSKATKKKVLDFATARAEVLVRRLIKTYADDQVVMIVDALISYCTGGKSIEDMQEMVVSAEVISDERLDAVRIVEQLTTTHTKLELRGIALYVGEFVKKHRYLDWFNRDHME